MRIIIVTSSKITAAAAASLQSCPTLCDPIDGSPPGSPVPWDSPGKNTGVGCHLLLQCMKVKSESEVLGTFNKLLHIQCLKQYLVHSKG